MLGKQCTLTVKGDFRLTSSLETSLFLGKRPHKHCGSLRSLILCKGVGSVKNIIGGGGQGCIQGERPGLWPVQTAIIPLINNSAKNFSHEKDNKGTPQSVV